MLVVTVTVISVFIITPVGALRVVEECRDISTNLTCPDGHMVNVTNAFYGFKDPYSRVSEPKCCSYRNGSNDCLAEYPPSEFGIIYNRCLYHQSCTVKSTTPANSNNTCGKRFSKFGRFEYECVQVNVLDWSSQIDEMRTNVTNVSLVYDDESSPSTTYSRDRTCLIQSKGRIRVSVVDILLMSTNNPFKRHHVSNLSKPSTPSNSVCDTRLSIIGVGGHLRLCLSNGTMVDTDLGKYQGPVKVSFKDNQPGDKIIIDFSGERSLNITCDMLIFPGGNTTVGLIDASELYTLTVPVIVLVVLVIMCPVLLCWCLRRRKQRREKCSELVPSNNDPNVYEYIDTEVPEGVRKGYILLPKKDKSLTLRFVKTVAMNNFPAGSDGSYCHIVKHHEPFHDKSPIFSGYKHICQIQTQQTDYDTKQCDDVNCDQQAEPLEENAAGSFDIKKDISATLQLRPDENSELLREIANEFDNESSAISDGLSVQIPPGVDDDSDHYEHLGQTKFAKRPAIFTDEKDTYNRLNIHNLTRNNRRNVRDDYDHLGQFKEETPDQNFHYNRLQI